MIQVNGIARASPTPRGVKKVTGSAVNGGGVDNFEEANKDIVDDIIVDYVDDEVGMMMMMIMMMITVMMIIVMIIMMVMVVMMIPSRARSSEGGRGEDC